MGSKVHPVVQQIEAQLREVVEGLGYELVLVKYGGPPRRPVLTVFIDREGGVTLGDCERVAQRLSVLLDVLDPIASSYELVVSSPGVERPLVRERDYIRFAGRQAALKTHTATGQQRLIEGTLRGVQEADVLVEHDGVVEAIPLASIEQAHLVYHWEEEQPGAGACKGG
jgi:ribosome maturation factor RimP